MFVFRRDICQARARDEGLHPHSAAAPDHHHQQGQLAQDVAGEHCHHHRPDGAGVSQRGGALSQPVCPAVVHRLEEHT